MTEISYGVDWLSATSTNDSVGQRWWLDYCKYEQSNAPLFAEDFRLQGGYQGRKCEGVAWAYSTRYGYYCHGTGSDAPHIWDWVQMPEVRVTRIDLRVDVIIPKADVDVAGRGYAQNRDCDRPSYRLIDKSASDGQTLYIGSMSSERFARLYDKGAERGQVPGFIWRYEVVIRKPYADAVYAQVKEGGIKVLPGLVYAWFDERNVSPLFQADAVGLASTETRVTTVEARLAWLRKSVRPAVLKLVQSGYAQETYQALGISIATSKTPSEIWHYQSAGV